MPEQKSNKDKKASSKRKRSHSESKKERSKTSVHSKRKIVEKTGSDQGGDSLSGVTQPMDSPNTRPLILLPQTKKTSKHHKTAHKENSVKVQRPESAKNVRNIFDFFLGKILTGI